ncbi:hypothetical protein SODALDRAFT_203184 [Sodiomyces alkalinus F11]|uniref:Uncharacterized protein n=1 Tax=Sodiomyces alkalinus (strain CBS 110278 / VKM F-3762 / F11) TaxID=1314773 RepID=A0A3N2PT45_SODAK|nr:hypothetical protein SODALDRAFT_203184 [Sodiomyces alkalinus F11]ROT37689.1 hypothetical protein SODALDRAFT_203184 [Sodiomyces alkalinus F11]
MRSSFVTFGLTALLKFAAPAWALGSVLEARAAQAVEVCDPPSSRGQPFDKLSSCGKARAIEENICRPENGGSEALQKHASCMCKGDFFPVKLACERCIRDHGGMSDRDFNFYGGILERSQNDLCRAETPAAPFATIWSAHRDIATMPTSGATAVVDKLATATDEAATKTTVQKLAESSESVPTKTAEPTTAATGAMEIATPLVTDTATIRSFESFTRGTNGLLTGTQYRTAGHNLTTGRFTKPPLRGTPRHGDSEQDKTGAGMQIQVLAGLLTGAAGIAAVALL